jgi:phage terminase small subunit
MKNSPNDKRIAELRGTMTTKQFKLATAILDGKKSSEAGRIAGYASACTTSTALSHDNVKQYIDEMRSKIQSNAIITREAMLQGLAEIFKGEHTENGKKDSAGRIAAAREICKVSGFYSPEKIEIKGSLVDRIRNGRTGTLA